MTEPTPAPRYEPRDPIAFWVPLAAGLALIGIGAFYVIAKQSRLIGPSLICTGLILLPWPAMALLGGLGFIGLGAYQFIVFKTVMLGAILVILGIVTLVDRGGRVMRKG